MQTTLALDQPRVIVIKQRDKKFTYRFRRIVDRDWKKYYSGITHQTEVVNGEQVRTFDLRTTLQSLVEETLDRVEGYTGPGGVDVAQLADWKMKLPIGHKIAAGLALADVGIEQPEDRDVSVLCDLTEISLSSPWSADENGIMFRISGLIHRFAHPSIDQLRTFNRESSRTRVVGGSRTGKTIWPGRQDLLAKFYDQLIASVDGYSYQGTELNDNVELIREQMDTQHKVAAAQALFSGGDEAEVSTEPAAVAEGE